MKKIVFIVNFFIIISTYGQEYSEAIQGEIIVKFKEEPLQLTEAFKEEKLAKLNSNLNINDFQSISNKQSKKVVRVKFSNGEFTLEEAIALFKATGYFEYVEPNYRASGSGMMNTTPNDTYYFRQWSLKNDGTFNAQAVIGADIDMELAWDIETGDSDMIVAIIDSGMRLSHPEISNRLWVNSDEVLDGLDTDGNGFIDDTLAGWDFINNDNDPTDDHGHGTNVGGIALASGNNSSGYAGVNWNSKIMICKALDQNNSGSYAAMAGAIYYAVDNGAKVINMSIGGASFSTTLSDAVDYCYDNGVILVACMMNFNNNVSYYPAAFDKTIAVGSTDPDDSRSMPFFWSATSGSNYGGHIDLVAPGNYMYGLHYASDTNYGYYWGGTSQATPLVTGVVSLILAINPSLTFEEVRTILWESSEDQVGDPLEDTVGFDQYYGYGRLNAFNALTHNTLGVGDYMTSNESLVIYPNPIQNQEPFTFLNLKEGNYDLYVYNTLGQKIYYKNNIEVASNNLNVELPLFNFKNGTYFFKLVNNLDNTSINRKVIVE